MNYSNGNGPLRWAVYARVSSVEQAGEDAASIDVQVRDCRLLVEREGGALVDTYVDDKAYYDATGHKVQPSGERADRPQWQRLLVDLKSGRVNAVAAWHTWRLYRDFRPFVDFIEIARETKPTVRLWHGQWTEQFAVFGAWMGRADNDHRAAQTGKGRRSKAEDGFAPTAMPGFYRTVRNEKGKRVGVELREAYRPWLDELARLFLEGVPYFEIARLLGTNPVTGRPMAISSVVGILKNEFMFGMIDIDKQARTPNRVLVPGKHASPWDEATRQAIRAEHARRAQFGHSQPHSGRFLFTGVLRCGYDGCGALLRGYQGTARPHARYACHKQWQVKRGYVTGVEHPPNSIGEINALAIVRALCRDMTPERAMAYAQAYAVPLVGPRLPGAAEVARLRDELAEIEAELDALPATAKRSRAGLEEDRRRLANRLSGLQQSAEAEPVQGRSLDDRAQSIIALSAALAVTNDPALLRPHIRDAWDALYIRDGQLVTTPKLLSS